MAKTRLQSAKERAPSIPPNTCPYIDSIIEILDDFELNKTDVDFRRRDIILSTLEYVREANSALRDSSKFWHDEFVKVVKRN
jgi:hypothetical protein